MRSASGVPAGGPSAPPCVPSPFASPVPPCPPPHAARHTNNSALMGRCYARRRPRRATIRALQRRRPCRDRGEQIDEVPVGVAEQQRPVTPRHRRRRLDRRADHRRDAAIVRVDVGDAQLEDHRPVRGGTRVGARLEALHRGRAREGKRERAGLDLGELGRGPRGGEVGDSLVERDQAADVFGDDANRREVHAAVLAPPVDSLRSGLCAAPPSEHERHRARHDDERARAGEVRTETMRLGVAELAIVVGVDAAALLGAGELAEEDRVCDADAVSEGGELEVAVVVVDRWGDVRGQEREGQHGQRGLRDVARLHKRIDLLGSPVVKSAARVAMKKALIICLLVGACGGDDPRQLFTPKPECKGDAITPYAGTFPQVINTLNIGSVQDGFDLDGDGKPDNKLSAVGRLAMSAIAGSIKNTEIVIPLEFFNLPTVMATSCVKFAIYLGISDADGDGKKPVQHNGDCDDHNPMVKKGMPEICGDGLDNDCDGVADRTEDGSGDSIACNPFSTTDLQDIPLDPLSLMGGQPVIAFTTGTIDSKHHIVAGPGTFSVNIPVTNGITLDLKISGATSEADLAADGTTMNGRLGGVIDAKTADTIRGLDVSQIGLTPQQSLLDATFANVLGSLLALPKAKASILKDYPDCRTPDIDVDGDGLEAVCDSDPNDDIKEVDTCIDGDGKVYKDEKDGSGTVTKQCTEFTDSKGKPLFVDGISVELNFTTSKIKSIKPPAAMKSCCRSCWR